MKNLLSILCISFFAQGALGYTASKVGFENYQTGKLPLNSQAGRWYTASEGTDESTVAEHALGKYLHIFAPVSPLYRTLYDNSGQTPRFFDINGDMAFDAMVQFTPAEPGVPVLEDDIKFALSLIVDDGNHKTNLVVTAAGPKLLSRFYTATNYCLNVENVDPAKWYRVTVRVIADTGAEVLGFVVYIDGNIVSCSDSDYYAKLPLTSNGNMIDGLRINATSKYLIRNKQFFVSRTRRNMTSANKLSSIGFKGAGNIDDLTICDAKESEVVTLPPIFEISWTKGIKSFNIDGKTYETANMADNRIYLHPESRKIAVSDVVYDFSNKYTNDTWTVVGASDVDGTYFMNGDGASLEIKALKVNFTIDGVPYDTLRGVTKAALADSRSGLRYAVRMYDDYVFNEAPVKPNGSKYLDVRDGEYMLDIAGHKLTLDVPSVPIMHNRATMTIIDSMGGGVITNVYSSSSQGILDAVFSHPSGSSGIITIGLADDRDKGVTICNTLIPPGSYNGSKPRYLTIERGRFADRIVARLCTSNEVSVCEDYGQYCVVSPKVVSPDEIAERSTEEAAEAVEMTAPHEVADILGDEALADYRKLFRRVVKPPSAEGGRYVIAFELDPEAVAAEGATMPDEAVAEIPIEEVAASGGSVDVERSVPGLYYTVMSGTDPGDVTSPGASVLGTGGKISLDVPSRGDRGFYRIGISAAPASR